MTDKPGRLVPDARRAWIAIAIMVPGSVLSGFVVGLLAALDGEVGNFDRLQVSAGLAALAIFFVAYTLLTVAAFRKLDRTELETQLPATTPRRRLAKVSWALSGGGATAWSSTAALFSLAAVVYVAFRPELRSNPTVLVISGMLVVSSWLTVAVTYAVQYMREDVATPGLDFPGDEAPIFADYFYLAIQVNATYSSSDVSLITRAMRRRLTRQTIIAFVFNSVIIALLVSALLIASSS